MRRARNLGLILPLSACVFQPPQLEPVDLPVALHFPSEASRAAHEGALFDNLDEASAVFDPIGFNVVRVVIATYPLTYDWRRSPLDDYRIDDAIGIFYVDRIAWGRERYCGIDLPFSAFCDRGVLLSEQDGRADLPPILLHEIGHVLGLQHVDDPANLMQWDPSRFGDGLEQEQLDRALWEANALAGCFGE